MEKTEQDRLTELLAQFPDRIGWTYDTDGPAGIGSLHFTRVMLHRVRIGSVTGGVAQVVGVGHSSNFSGFLRCEDLFQTEEAARDAARRHVDALVEVHEAAMAEARRKADELRRARP